ncbi:hypothetical protein [Laceyella putida]|uniref:Uncharacterized protein n=1 Tax=Laceyella putida TaxID=110101 RepID=A0ABW2RQC9_9BACL
MATYRVGNWKVPQHVNFDEKRDARKGLVVLKCLSGVFDLKEVTAAYSGLGIDLNGKPFTELEPK